MNIISTHLETAKNKFSRISWGGVFAGAIVAITIAFLLNILGLGIGLTSIDPLTEYQTFDGLGTGTIIWWVISNLAALFVGGLVAARAAGLPSSTDGGIHGFIAWGLYLLLSIYLITNITGSIFSGMGSLVSSVFGGDQTKEVVLNLKNAQKDVKENSNLTLDGIRNEMFEIIETAENYNIIPNDSKESLKENLNKTENETSKAIRQLNLKDAISDFVNDISVDLNKQGDLKISVEGNKDYINKEELKSYLVDNTDLSQAEINGVINKWDRKIENTITKLENTYSEAKQDALKASEEITDNLGLASIYLFFILFSGALAAFFGGATGVPILNVSEEHQKDLAEDRANTIN